MDLNCEQLREELYNTKEHKKIFDLLLHDFRPGDDPEHRKRVYLMKREVGAQLKYIERFLFNPEKIKKELAEFLATNLSNLITDYDEAASLVEAHSLIDRKERLVSYSKNIGLGNHDDVKFPEKVAMTGGTKLEFNSCKNLTLPDNFVSYGDMVIDDCEKVSMPSRMEVGGKLTIQHCVFVDYPKFIKANSLFMHGPNIDKLPELDVFGALNIKGTNVSELPSGLKLEGLLDIRDTLITRLPNDLQVRGGLMIDKRLEVQAQMLVDKGQVSHYETT